jgi:glycosyltransferase involved in cell wall biosynthesis/SAM-dependent methyltransferase
VPRNGVDGHGRRARTELPSSPDPSSGTNDRSPDLAGLESEHAELLLRLTELDQQRKWNSAHRADPWGEELRACWEGLAELHGQLEAIHRSDSWRIGNGVIRAVKATIRPAATAISPLLRVWRTRAGKLSRTYRQATAATSPLATVGASPGSQPSDENDGSLLASAVHDLRQARADGSRLLEPGELDALRRATETTDHDPELGGRARELLALLAPVDMVDMADRGSGSLVVDVRALQIPFECGTKTHAEHVLHALRSTVKSDVRLLMVRSPALPDVAPQVAAMFDGQFMPRVTPIDEVSAYIQLMTSIHGNFRYDIDLLRAPGVRRAALWLDGIMGEYPSTFLRSDAAFLDYQLGIERLGRASHVVALSESSLTELPPNLNPSTRISISGSRPGFTRADARFSSLTKPDGRYCVIVGNALPHKNVAAGIAAFAASRRGRRDHLTLMVAAGGLNPEQRGALSRLAAAAGGDAGRLVFLPELERCDFARLIQGAEAVVVPSFHEGFSLPVVESIGLATPVVASDIPAHRELLGGDPALAQPSDPFALAKALDAVLAQRNQVVARQQRALDKHYDPERLDRAIANLTSELLDEAPSDANAPRVIRLGSDEQSEPAAYTEAAPAVLLSQSKVCNLEDFSHPDLMEELRRHFPHEAARFGPEFPKGREWRKYWEIAMAMRTFSEAGLLDGRHDFLGVGAGNEPTIFMLTRYARRLVASDLYLDPEWGETAAASMLSDPGWHWPFDWYPKHLRVTNMDARDLQFPDQSFHGIFSSSSIEHFGGRRSIAGALDEMHRVLTPGGTLSISSEYRIAGPAPGMPGVAMFDTQDIDDLFVGDRSWKLVDPFDDTVSTVTLESQVDYASAVEDQRRQINDLGGYWTHLIEFDSYPHIVLSQAPHLFTSFHIALRKDD